VKQLCVSLSHKKGEDGMQEHEKYMGAAILEAEKALQAGDFPVGCVLVCDDKIVARGRRRHSRNDSANELDHAEIIALRSLLNLHSSIQQEKLILYSTMEPCLMCFSTLLLNGVHRIVYGYEDVMGGGTNLPLAQMKPLYRETEVEIVPHVRRNECLALYKMFFEDPSHSYWQNSLLAKYTLAQDLVE
jgi:tRNA(adenine34) deaminase